MAKLSGARQVIATVSNEEKAWLARTAGADVVIDYRREDVAAHVRELTGGRGVDRIVEVDFAANVTLDFAAIARGGRIVVYGSGKPDIPVPFVPAILENVDLSFFIVYHLGDVERTVAVDRLTQWLGANALQHNIAARLPLAAIVEAHETVESGRATGNVVLDVASS
jgi:NADPH2:quinone reductase